MAKSASTPVVAESAPTLSTPQEVGLKGMISPDGAPAADASVPTPPQPVVAPEATAETPRSLEDRVAALKDDVSSIDSELECMAKVIDHEAANQSLKGQLAVAQLMLHRMHSPLFPKTLCAVANQRGQFFATARYMVSAKSTRWRVAVAIARIAREDNLPELAPGALFYHASYVNPSWARHRAVVARIGAHVFYR